MLTPSQAIGASVGLLAEYNTVFAGIGESLWLCDGQPGTNAALSHNMGRANDLRRIDRCENAPRRRGACCMATGDIPWRRRELRHSQPAHHSRAIGTRRDADWSRMACADRTRAGRLDATWPSARRRNHSHALKAVRACRSGVYLACGVWLALSGKGTVRGSTARQSGKEKGRHDRRPLLFAVGFRVRRQASRNRPKPA